MAICVRPAGHRPGNASVPLGFAQESDVKADIATERDVLGVLRAYFAAITARDEPAVLALFADDADLVLFGSGADERRVGKTELLLQTRRDWSQSHAMSFTIDWSSVSSASNVAWVATELTVSIAAPGQTLTLPARFSVVLEQRVGRWMIVQGHFSFPAGGQPEGASFPKA